MSPFHFGDKSALGTIVVFVRDLLEPFYLPMMMTIEQIADANGYGVVFVRKSNASNQHIDYMALVGHQADGIIFLGEGTMKLFEGELLLAMGKPFVIFQGSGALEGASYLRVDNEKAAYEAMTHLVNHGHRRILHITAPMYHFESLERARGYEHAVKDYALEYQHKIHIDLDYESIYDMGCRLGELVRKERLTAAFCFNDRIATGIIDGLVDQGIDIPGKFSVVGFDDLSFRHLSRNWIPEITSIKQPQEKIGAYAVEKVIDMIENGIYDASKTFRCHLVDRDTVRML